MKCQYCGADVVLPFKCPFCGGYYCVKHRLPENHECPELWKAWLPRREIEPRVRIEEPIKPSWAPYLPPSEGRLLWFSFKEIGHLLAGTLLVMAVGISIILTAFFPFSPHRWRLDILLSSALVFASIFILHELSHKAVAQYYGMWAEFRLNMMGVLITLLSIFLPIKLISPGSVMVVGEADRSVVGKSALAGPLTNIVLSLIFMFWALILHSSSAIIGAVFSPWIALFNLIPFGMLDGAKVLWWNWRIWAVSFSVSLLLTVLVLLIF